LDDDRRACLQIGLDDIVDLLAGYALDVLLVLVDLQLPEAENLRDRARREKNHVLGDLLKSVALPLEREVDQGEQDVLGPLKLLCLDPDCQVLQFLY